LKTRRRLGEMLIEVGLATAEQIDRAAQEQQKSNLKLGQALMRSGVVSGEQIAETLSRQLRIERYQADRYPVDESLAALLPAEIAQRYQIVPLQKRNRLLFLGTVDPTDLRALDIVEQMTHDEVEPVICTEREINQLTSAIYGSSLGVGDILASADAVEFSTASPEESGSEVEVRSLVDLAEGAPAVRVVNWIVAQAVRESASDIHISPERTHIQLRFRVDGRLREVPAPPKAMLLSIVSRIKILAHMDISVSRIPQDGRFTTRIENREINVRASTIPTINGENVVLRLLDMSGATYTLDRLGMVESDRTKIAAMIQRPHGMILSTGPTGSGKSTSLYAILRELNTPDVNIVTVEDPVEYRVDRIRQVQLNAKAGMTFASGLRSILRQDPDVIMVGEIRDAETARVAIQAALTGHLVLSTAHTNDAVGAITRMMDMGIEPFLVASVLAVSFAQRLLRRACRKCAVMEPAPAAAMRFWGIPEGTPLKRAVGCQACLDTGYQGRVGVFEVLVVDDDVERMISASATAHEITTFLRQSGRLRTLKEDAAEKVRQGLTTMEEAASGVVV
jgi:type IV pilus assembly protein PilB